MVNTINSQPDPDFARNWWNKVRTNPGTVLTKKKRHQKELAQKDYQIQLLQNANGILEVEHFPLREEIARLEGVIGEWEERYNERIQPIKKTN